MKTLRSNILISTLIIMLLKSNGYAQVGTMAQVNSHQSPDAASLGKYVEIPVGYYSGIPQISVPLYDLKANGITLPVSLSYHASGIKVKDVPGWVGTGFSLNAGGVINRVVRGFPDDHDPYVPGESETDNYDKGIRARIKSAANIGFETEFTSSERYYMATSTPGVVKEEINPLLFRMDTEYDLFYFNFAGNMGQFTFDNEGNPMLLSGNDLKIEYNLRKFKITDANGIEYYFEALEQTMDVGTPIKYYTEGRLYTTSWFLSRIRSPQSGAEVNFTYKSYHNYELYDQTQLGSYANAFYNRISRLKFGDYTISNYIYGNNNDCPPYDQQYVSSAPHHFANALFLDEITWDGNKKIKFYGELNRLDLYKYKLDSISVQNGTETVRRIKFQYTYFNNAVSAKKYKRLKLENVTVNDQKYEFGYIDSFHGISTPPIDTKGQDLWGYYNAEDENRMLGGTQGENNPSNYQYQPYYKIYDSFPDPNIPFYIPYRNSTYKNSDAKYAQLGMLSSIKYPTGGKTFFTYEGNDYSTFPFIDPAYSRIEDDPYTQLKMDSVYTKQCRALIGINLPSPEPNGTRNFVIHYGQTVGLQGAVGLEGGVSYTQYNDYILNEYPYATLKLQKYNDITSVFDDLESYEVSPADSIGNPVSEWAYGNVKQKGTYRINKTKYLNEGRYRIVCEALGAGTSSSLNVNLRYSYKKSTGIYNAGGVRIKKIAFVSGTDVDSSYVKNYDYKDGVNSAGVLESPFANIYRTYLYGLSKNGPFPFTFKQSVCEFFAFTSDPIIPLGNSQGGVVGYSKVTEKREDNSKMVYYFTNGNDPDEPMVDEFVHSSVLPTRIRLLTDNSWKRGLQKQVDVYNAQNSLVKQDFKQYYFLTAPVQRSISLVLDDIYFGAGSSYLANTSFINRFNNYSLIKKDSTVIYNSNGNLFAVQNYEYDISKHNYPNKITSTLSDGSKTIVNLKYPQDFSITGSPTDTITKAISTMLFRHVVAPVVEKYVQKKDANGSNLRTVSAELSVFKPTAPLPYAGYVLETTAALTDFLPLSVSSSSTVKDSRYQASAFVWYDNFGNMAQVSKVGQSTSAYLWDYNNAVLVAEVSNAKTADIAYTGFEADGKGSWTFAGTPVIITAAPVGNKVYRLAGGQISKTNLSSATNYILAYWRKNDASVTVTGGTVSAEVNKNVVPGWTYVERRISGTTSITISGTGNIDELRLYPAGAEMITYTYTPLIGLTTKTDARGETAYYEYDSYGRLKDVKDQQGKIIKGYTYHYKP